MTTDTEAKTTVVSEHCATCGYTKQDAIIHADHHLCSNKNPPWEKPDETHVNVPRSYVDKLENQNIQFQSEITTLRDALRDLRNGAANCVEDQDWPGLQEHLFEVDAILNPTKEEQQL